jgi:hypothetical protein
MKLPSLPFLASIGKRFSSGRALILWYRYYKLVLFLVFLLTLSYGGWVYYYNVYQYHFTDAEKKQYVDSYYKETTFKEARFQEMVDRLTTRARMHEVTLDLKRDIFESK